MFQRPLTSSVFPFGKLEALLQFCADELRHVTSNVRDSVLALMILASILRDVQLLQFTMCVIKAPNSSPMHPPVDRQTDCQIDRHSFDGFVSKTAWVNWHQKG